jgi:hypothetical protein
MSVDPQVQALLDQMAAAQMPDISTLSVAEARATAASIVRILPPGPEVARVETSDSKSRVARLSFARMFRRARHAPSWCITTAEVGSPEAPSPTMAHSACLPTKLDAWSLQSITGWLRSIRSPSR